MEARIHALLRTGRTDDAVAAAEALVTAESLREGGWAGLIAAVRRHRVAPRTRSRAFQRAARCARRCRPRAVIRCSVRRTGGTRGGDVVRPAMTPVSAAGGATSPAPERSVPASPPSSFVGRDHDRALVGRAAPAGPSCHLDRAGWRREDAPLLSKWLTSGAPSVMLSVPRLPSSHRSADGAAAADAIVHVLGLGSDAVTALEALDRVATWTPSSCSTTPSTSSTPSPRSSSGSSSRCAIGSACS